MRKTGVTLVSVRNGPVGQAGANVQNRVGKEHGVGIGNVHPTTVD